MSLPFAIDPRSWSPRLSRRDWLRIGGLSSCGLAAQIWSGGTQTKATEPAGSPSRQSGFGQAKSVIVLYASGGQSQLDTWDPKPNAPQGIRGEFQSIATSLPGVRVCEHMPRLARLAHLYTIIRTMSHDDLDHGSATYLSLTGQFHPQKTSNPLPHSDDAPTLGAILPRVRPSERFPYSAVNINGPLLIPELPSPGQYGGFLGRQHEPLILGDVTDSTTSFTGLDPQPDLPIPRQSSRTSLLDAIDRARWRFAANRSTGEWNELYRQARSLLDSPRYRDSFDLSQESDTVRDRYGRFRAGQACLLAKRLVEAGVPLITVFLSHSSRGQDLSPQETERYGWDTHNDIFYAMKQHLLPRFDICFSALLEDLDRSGLLESTLVICMGEFGRAPQVALEPNFAGSTPGRKHWAATYSIVMAGAGVKRGHIVGVSDRIAAYPETNPYFPGDIAATIFAALGIDPSQHYTDNSGRPWPMATGKPIRELYG